MHKYKVGDLVEWRWCDDEWALCIITEVVTSLIAPIYQIKMVAHDSHIDVPQANLRLPTYYPTPMGELKSP